MRTALLLLFALSLTGCGSLQFRPENAVYVPVNLALDELDNYASRGSFPKIDKPLLKWGPLRFSTSFRTKFSRRDEERNDPNLQPLDKPRNSGPSFGGTNAKIDWDMIYLEFRFRW